MHEVQQLPAKQGDGNKHDHHGHQFTKTPTATIRLEAAGYQAQNVQRGKAEHKRPKNIVNISLMPRELNQNYAPQPDKWARDKSWGERANHAGLKAEDEGIHESGIFRTGGKGPKPHILLL